MGNFLPDRCSPAAALDGTDSSIAVAQTPISFLSLPGEVRNKIYRYGLIADCKDRRECVWSNLGLQKGQTYVLATGLLRVSQQISREASSIFHGENGFVLIRDTRHNALELLLERRIPAIAVTNKASACMEMVMIFQFGDPNIDSNQHPGIQIVVAAQDFEVFVLATYELQLSAKMPNGFGVVIFAVKLIKESYFSTGAAKQNLLKPLNLLLGSEMALNNTFWQYLTQGRAYLPSVINSKTCNLFFQTLGGIGDAKYAAGNYTSAAFYHRKLEEAISQGLLHYAVRLRMTRSQYICHILKCKHKQAKALTKARHYRTAHETIKAAISIWQGEPVPKVSHTIIAEMCCLRARLDEVHGSLLKLRNAVFWFEEALRLDPNRCALRDDIERLEKEIFILDSSNW